MLLQESRDTDVPQKSLPRPSPEVSLEKERSFHQTREWLNSGSFATRCHDDEGDTSGSVAAQTSSVASFAEAGNANNRRSLSPRPLSPPGVRHDQTDLLNSTMFATPQKYGTSFRAAAASSPRDSHLVDGSGRTKYGEKRQEFKGDDRGSWLPHSEHTRRCRSVNPSHDDSQGRVRSKDATSRRCYSETPNDGDKFSPLLVDDVGVYGIFPLF